MASPGITHEQFAKLYAQQVGIPLEALVKGGMSCTPCACGANYCLGWTAYWAKTGREEHGNPQQMVGAINKNQDFWGKRGWS